MWLGVGKGYAGFYRKSLAIFLRLFYCRLQKQNICFIIG